MKYGFLWVVEMLINGKWEATTAVGIRRRDALDERHGMETANPHDKFRTVRYRREKKGGANG